MSVGLSLAPSPSGISSPDEFLVLKSTGRMLDHNFAHYISARSPSWPFI